MIRILILGGTTEAATLARTLAAWSDVSVTTSLAGRTRTPEMPTGTTRVGGFGGPEGLVSYLRDHAIDVLVDATHPFAERMGRHAVAATETVGIRRLRLMRRPWSKRPEDRWIDAIDGVDAARSLPGLARRVFLTTGHRDLGAFADLDDIWFLIRTIEPVTGSRPRRALCLQARGPFDEAGEIALFEEHRIGALVTKASGGQATYAKIAAARKLGLPVIMIRRPEPPPGPVVHDTGAALAWLRQVTA